ncbi:hypothetical protein AGMMS49991_03400 [Spirochaetia bacterium]|nr:hypothetical protein AGMMS49991_03400 [Spirochaetia bacterium]
MVKFMKSAVFKIDLAYPFFCGMVISAYICSSVVYPRLIEETAPFAREALAGSVPDAFGTEDSPVPGLTPGGSTGPNDRYPAGTIHGKPVKTPDWGFPGDEYSVTGDVPSFIPPPLAVSVKRAKEDDIILKAYRDSVTRDRVAAFFGGIIRSPELAGIILDNADRYNIAPSLAFALCWEESRFNVQAVSRINDNGSVDRGLFQLNNKSFPQIKEQEFFNPRLNAYHAMSHLRWCLDTGGSPVAGLAMYNAGTNRVAAGTTPKRTLDYVSRILDSQRQIEELFDSHGVLAIEITVDEEEVVASKHPAKDKPRLALLMPVSTL